MEPKDPEEELDEFSAVFFEDEGEPEAGEPTTSEALPEDKPLEEMDSGEPVPKTEEKAAVPEEPKPAEKDWKVEAERLEKIARDNQAAFTQRSQESAELKRRIDELEAQLRAKPAQQPQEPEVPEGLADLFSEFPNAKDGLDKWVDQQVARKVQATIGDPAVLSKQKQEIEHLNDRLYKMDYERKMTYGFRGEDGKFVEGHADWPTIMHRDDFWEWHNNVKKYPPAPGNHGEAIRRVSEWKTEVLQKAVAEGAKASEAKAQKTEDILRGGVRPGSTGRPQVSKKDPMDFNAGFFED